MFVLKELKKSIKDLEDIIKAIDAIDSISEFDSYEVKAQGIVFELQMKANQIAGELVPKMHDKRIELQNSNAQYALDRVRAAKERAKSQSDNLSDNKEETKEVKDGGDSNRQPEPDAGDSKPKSTKKNK